MLAQDTDCRLVVVAAEAVGTRRKVVAVVVESSEVCPLQPERNTEQRLLLQETDNVVVVVE